MSISSISSRDNICPVCSSNNQCARSVDANATSCWCIDTDIDPEILKRIPDSAQGKVCICPSCAQSAKQLAREIS